MSETAEMKFLKTLVRKLEEATRYVDKAVDRNWNTVPFPSRRALPRISTARVYSSLSREALQDLQRMIKARMKAIAASDL